MLVVLFLRNASKKSQTSDSPCLILVEFNLVHYILLTVFSFNDSIDAIKKQEIYIQDVRERTGAGGRNPGQGDPVSKAKCRVKSEECRAGRKVQMVHCDAVGASRREARQMHEPPTSTW